MKNKTYSVFDLHCDTPINIYQKKFAHIKPEYLSTQHYLGAVFAHFIHPERKFPFVGAVKLLSSTIHYIEKSKNLRVIRSPGEIDKHKTNIILGVEGGHIFDNTIKQIEVLYDLGVRVFTITWNNSNKLAGSALDNDKKGLTKKGRSFVKKMGDLGIVIDLSHASTRTALDVCEIAENGVIASHSCVRDLNPSYLRNIDDRAIKAVAECGGVVGINFSRYHLGKHSVFEHIDYLVNKFGIDIAAIGSDFDGINDPVIPDPSGIEQLAEALSGNGYKISDIKKIFYGNFLRVFSEIK